MQLDIISDPVCPWCYIGKKRMELALASRPDMPIDLAYRVFQLDPDMPRGGMDRKALAETSEILDQTKTGM